MMAVEVLIQFALSLLLLRRRVAGMSIRFVFLLLLSQMIAIGIV